MALVKPAALRASLLLAIRDMLMITSALEDCEDEREGHRVEGRQRAVYWIDKSVSRLCECRDRIKEWDPDHVD